MNDVLKTEASYETAMAVLYKLIDEMPLRLELLERDVLEQRVADKGGSLRNLERKCVNYLRHDASAYDEIANKLSRSRELELNDIERHVLHIERRRVLARLKERILEEIATNYPWLRKECREQAWLDGVAGHPGDFVLSFGPFKGRKLRQLDTEHLIGLLGQSFVKGSFRTRIERHLTERVASLARSTVNAERFRGDGSEQDGTQN